LLLTVLTVGVSALLSRPFTSTISEVTLQRRGIRDDVAEAVLLKEATRVVGVIVASVLVRWLAGRRE